MKVIIVGAGASGLMAAYELTRKGIEVILLEAENRIGGRIQSLTPPGFIHQVEAGAEFIHGDLPLTLRLMKKAGLGYMKAGGKMYRSANGKIEQQFGQGKQWNEFYGKLENVRRDLTLDAFIAKHFSGDEYALLRDEVFAMAQGLDLADPTQMSVVGIKKEWLAEGAQYRTLTGYQPLMTFLYDQCALQNFSLHLNETVTKIDWKQGAATVVTENNSFIADAVLLTLPVPCYNSDNLYFVPKLPVANHFRSIGFGEVIKAAIEFEHAFWESSQPDLGFLFCGEFTFWTQLTSHKPFLVGWIGNQYASNFENISDSDLLKMMLEKLQACFGETDITTIYRAGAVFRFTRQSRSCGGYSWLKPESKKAIMEINSGVENTIWFAGEALHPGAEPGTVEAALQSGRHTAGKILKTLN
jgi:monoamine oxidase